MVMSKAATSGHTGVILKSFSSGCLKQTSLLYPISAQHCFGRYTPAFPVPAPAPTPHFCNAVVSIPTVFLRCMAA